MYFGTDSCAESMWAFVNGQRWAEYDLDFADGEVTTFNLSFQAWVDNRYPFGRDQNWGRLFAISHVGSGRSESDYLFEHINLFLSNAGSGVQDARTAEIIRNILDDQRQTETVL